MEQKKIIVNVTDFVNKEIDAALRVAAASNVKFVKYAIVTASLDLHRFGGDNAVDIKLEVVFEHDDIEKLSSTEKSNLPVQVKFTVSDIIRLHPISDTGESAIKRFGHWWKAPSNSTGKRGEKYIITNLPRQMQGKFAGEKNASYPLELRKENDPHFIVIDVCPFPKAFMHQQYKL